MEYKIPLDEQNRILATVDKRTDAEAERIKRYLAMPDLSRTPGSPLYEIVQARDGNDNRSRGLITSSSRRSCRLISISIFSILRPIIRRESKSDTYYADDKNILRTHDTVMWYYYTQLPEVKARLARREKLGVVCYGKVYRKDEIDRQHMNIFHQFGGWYMTPADTAPLTIDDLRNALTRDRARALWRRRKVSFSRRHFPVHRSVIADRG